jgi:hypothetical protein
MALVCAVCRRRRCAAPRVIKVFSEEDSLRLWAIWRKLIKRLFRLRSRQRLWAYIGHLLQGYPANLRNRLVLIFPTGLHELRARRREEARCR